MVFKCQEDSFLKEYITKVKSIEPCEDKGFNVILEDTILFPEGGGQPCDYGTLNHFQVTNVTRKGNDAIHFLDTDAKELPIKPGDEIQQILDWNRRHDHMQQHSGQHLITAIFDQEYKLGTKSWWLGSETSFIEINGKDVTEDQMKHVEKICNGLIAAATPVQVNIYAADDPMLMSDELRVTKDLPEDVVGPIRVVTIQGIESNRCCGTHVTNLSQLQAVKLLNVEKTKGKVMVHFLVGNRVLKKLSECLDREQQLIATLNGGPEMHVELTKKLQSNQKASSKLLKTIARELAAFEAEKFLKGNEKRYHFIHRHDGMDADYMNAFLRNVSEAEDTLFFITLGDESNKGSFVLQGPTEITQGVSDSICKALDAKGNGKGTRFQGKVNNLKGVKECDKIILDYFSTQNDC